MDEGLKCEKENYKVNKRKCKRIFLWFRSGKDLKNIFKIEIVK